MENTCVNCGSNFEIFDEDLALLDKLSPVVGSKKYPFPPPTHCPPCREQRRLVLRNERNIYYRKCDLTGKEIVSLYSPDKPYVVYDEDVWWSDDWDPLDYGRDFDFNRPFFDQFDELLRAVPRRSMHRDGTNENCTYCSLGMGSRNCYMGFSLMQCEEVYYSTRVYMSNNCVDCFISGESELLYDCVGCGKCYSCAFCHDSHGCRDSYFLENCRNCDHCISCKNIQGKKYHIYNKQVTEEEYDEYLTKMREDGFVEERKKFEGWKIKLPNLYAQILQSENSTGEYLDGAKNCHHCFEIIGGSEDTRYSQYIGMGCKDSMDCTMAGMQGELLYEVHASIQLQRCAFVTHGIGSDLYYCDTVRNNSRHCFGCSGLTTKSYCILNKQYTKEEYFTLLPRIIEHMQKTGEWGEMMPVQLSPFAYNETIANDYYPLSKEEVQKKGWQWREEDIEMPKVEKVIPGSKLPATIDVIPDEVVDWAIECEVTGKPFRIIRQELDFYRKMKLPLPRLHPEERHKSRLPLRNPHRLYERQCDKCQKEIATAYSPERPEILYCEECYRKEVY